MSATATVLVIEDNPMNADVLRETLADAGYESMLAVNGAAGVALANELLPDIILMDVNLPILDGLSATKLLKNNGQTKGIPVLALTARAMIEDRDICLEAGCDDYVSKPVDMEVLLAKMRHHLERRSPAFVEMLQRQRPPARPLNREEERLRPGMDVREYEEELAALNAAVERAERAEREAREKLAARDQELERTRRQLESADARIRLLQALVDGTGEPATAELRAQHENLRRAFMNLHRAVSKAAEDAMHDVAFGRTP
jgi:DNA-binding response OmpR family regulator